MQNWIKRSLSFLVGCSVLGGIILPSTVLAKEAKPEPKAPIVEPCHCPNHNLISKIEFNYAERLDGDDALISIDQNKPTLMLETAFHTICSGDLVWLNGMVVLDHEYEPDTEDGEVGREAENANITIIIEKYSDLIPTPSPIYTLEVDLVPGSDDVAIPFSHIDLAYSHLENVHYRVLVYSDCPLAEDADIEGPNTLAAIRFIK